MESGGTELSEQKRTTVATPGTFDASGGPVAWIDVENHRILPRSTNDRLVRAMELTAFLLHGDAELAVFIAPTAMWPGSLTQFVGRVGRDLGGGWIRKQAREDAERGAPPLAPLSRMLEDFGTGFVRPQPGRGAAFRAFVARECGGEQWRAWLPPGEHEAPYAEAYCLQWDGNFRMAAVRTDDFLYLVCFATS